MSPAKGPLYCSKLNWVSYAYLESNASLCNASNASNASKKKTANFSSDHSGNNDISPITMK